ncbi:hypothetical protein EKH55_1321 [Sinorhizobium alkalisoli]|nr:hypothetical protein EKH55_1321 [Sinorhizobium alkalisoli]
MDGRKRGGSRFHARLPTIALPRFQLAKKRNGARRRRFGGFEGLLPTQRKERAAMLRIS